MKLSELRDGWNGPKVEIDYVTSIGSSIGALLGLADCKSIEVVGSRATYSYISVNRLYKYLHEYNDTMPQEYDDTMKLFALLDNLAHMHNLCSKDLPVLADYLPRYIHSGQRDRIIRSLERGVASDWDLLIPRRLEGIETFHSDEKTGAYLEIFIGSKRRQAITHHYPDY